MSYLAVFHKTRLTSRVELLSLVPRCITIGGCKSTCVTYSGDVRDLDEAETRIAAAGLQTLALCLCMVKYLPSLL